MRSSPRGKPVAAEGRAALVRRARKIAALLAKEYPDARCALDHRGPFELLIATILAAQCTDERVNKVTPGLFARFPDAAAMAGADIADLEALVRSTGFFHAKAKSIRGAAEALARRFASGFPSRMEDLLTLPGRGTQDRQRGARHLLRQFPPSSWTRTSAACRSGSASPPRTTPTGSSGSCRISCPTMGGPISRTVSRSTVGAGAMRASPTAGRALWPCCARRGRAEVAFPARESLSFPQRRAPPVMKNSPRS